MKVLTKDLTGKALDWAVFIAEGMSYWKLEHVKHEDDQEWVLHQDGTIRSATEVPSSSRSRQYNYVYWEPHIDWAQGGPIIEREGIAAAPWCSGQKSWKAAWNSPNSSYQTCGPTEPVAKMRCLVLHKLGDEVDVPEGFVVDPQTKSSKP